MIAVHISIRVEDWIIDLSHLIMHRVKTFIAIIAVNSGFKIVEHLFN